MDVLLRDVTERPDGVSEYHDTEVSVDAVTIGSAPDRVIQLLGSDVAREHAALRSAGGGRARLSCERGHKVRVNGKDVSSATVGVGDRLEIGGHRIDPIAAPAGFDLAFEIRRNLEVQSSAFKEAFQTDLKQTWLGKRGPSWLLLALVVATTLAIPLLLLRDEDEGRERSAALALLPTDELWSTGPILPAHELAIGDDCSACHRELFQRVTDDACTECHENTLDHIAHARAVSLGAEPDRCATCHREHNEPVSLVVRNDDLCTDCHANPARFEPHVVLDAVTGFTAATHPAFDVQLIKPVADEAGTGLVFDWKPTIESLAGAREESHLKFPHDVHLDASRVQRPSDGAALGCSGCHTLSPDQEHFLPITMEAHCRDCHDLKFDRADPTRELPHGNPLEVVLAIEGHFMRKFADPASARQTSTRRRLPDRASADDTCTEGVYACGRRRTEQEAINQFTRRGCVTCHDVNDNASSDLYSRFQVYPVRLAADYFPTARFDHASHLTQKGATGDAACLTCHAANVATTSDQVLVPNIDNCVDCHGDVQVSERVPLLCIDCHAYHPAQHALLTIEDGGS